MKSNMFNARHRDNKPTLVCSTTSKLYNTTQDVPCWRGENILSCDGENRDAFLKLGNEIEALVNIHYLMRLEIDESDRVFEWLEMADIHAERIIQILKYESSR
jgi:hypothetical protein